MISMATPELPSALSSGKVPPLARSSSTASGVDGALSPVHFRRTTRAAATVFSSLLARRMTSGRTRLARGTGRAIPPSPLPAGAGRPC